MSTDELGRPEDESTGAGSAPAAPGGAGAAQGDAPDREATPNDDEDLFVLELEGESAGDETRDAGDAADARDLWAAAGSGDDLFADLDGPGGQPSGAPAAESLSRFEDSGEDADFGGDEFEFVLEGDAEDPATLADEDDLFADLDSDTDKIAAETPAHELDDAAGSGNDQAIDDLVLVEDAGMLAALQQPDADDGADFATLSHGMPAAELAEGLTTEDADPYAAPYATPYGAPQEPPPAMHDAPAAAGAGDFAVHDIPDDPAYDFGGEDDEEVRFSPEALLDLGDAPTHMRPSGTWTPVDDDELTLVDHDEELQSGIMPALERVLRPANQAGGPEEADPIYGARPETELEAHPVFRGMAPPQRVSHLESILPDAEQHAPAPAVVGTLGAPRRRVWVRRMMAVTMAASVLVLGLVAFVTLRPDLPAARKVRTLLGLRVAERPSVEVVNVGRPRISLELEVPGIEISPDLRTALLAEQPVAPDTPDTPSGTATPRPEAQRKLDRIVKGLTWVGKQAGGIARTLLPRGAKPDTPLVARTDPPTSPPVAPVGSGNPRQTPPVPPADPESPGAAPPGAATALPKGACWMTDYNAGIVRGVTAFAQLHNGHFFVGRVQKVVPEELVLALEASGEIAFVPGDLQKLLPLAEAEARTLKGSPDGYVRLKNKNKIWGKILEDLPDVVTIETNEARIVLPKTSVLEVSKKPDATIQLGKEEEDWTTDDLPAVEGPQMPVPEKADDVPAGAVRVKLGPTPAERARELQEKVQRRLPAVPGRK